MVKKKTSHGLSDKVSDVVLVVITAIVLLIVAYAIELAIFSCSVSFINLS